MHQVVEVRPEDAAGVTGEFLTIGDERFYAIRHVDGMAPFFMSIISSSDHWLFVSSAGGLSAGRVSPESALFPYIPVDRIHEASPHTGSKTLLRAKSDGATQLWEPFGELFQSRHCVSRNLYKNLLGNKLCFEEVNHSLDLTFRYTWSTSDRYGFVRQAELLNTGDSERRVDVLDGLQNLLPAGTPLGVQTNASNLVDAYRWSELDASTGLALYTVYAGISDHAEPSESLRANTVFSLGLDSETVLLSSDQVDTFRQGGEPLRETCKRGLRGAFFSSATVTLGPWQSRQWQIVANVEQSQSQAVDLRLALRTPDRLAEAVSASVDSGSDELARIMASADGLQKTAEEMVGAHHYANVLFNTLRGGIFDDQYAITAHDLADTVRQFNRNVFARNRDFLDGLPERIDVNELRTAALGHGDPQLTRLCYEYLPVTFGRRHGDPSRPWNRFAIRLKDEHGRRRLSYEGNWRDIFQNWEALAISYPEFIENIIAKFVNASTIDGYNPYRIGSDGIDWEIESPDDPWGTIGYWGDHQVIYLLKLLELSRQFHPTRLSDLLRRPIFSYANVPYRIRPFESLLENSKDTVDFDQGLADRIAERESRTGADGRLVFDADNNVYQVTLLEKLLVPLLTKLGNLVPDGGIWLNTQRPEWNDANNALVGNGLSMVTLYYMRRYVQFLRELLSSESEAVVLSTEVIDWITNTSKALREVAVLPADDALDSSSRFEILLALGVASDEYRQAVYDKAGFSGKDNLDLAPIRQLLDDALTVIDRSIRNNRREDGLYHAYNLLEFDSESIELDTLYPMLEGQVAALSSGAIGPEDACSILDSLFDSDIYRPDQQSFMLYADRELPGFLDKNRMAADDVGKIPLLRRMLKDRDERVILQDVIGTYRFNADFRNVGDLERRLDEVREPYGAQADDAREAIIDLYEKVFNHRAFTGRSGTMFGFEGLGCIYWHMVSKLLLATGEIFQAAIDDGADDGVTRRLGSLYYRIRDGLGFNKTPGDYGAFPMDPYSHTPKHAGARQPGMTGQVKEEIIARFGELGLTVSDGSIRIDPRLLRRAEFAANPGTFRYLDVTGDWRELALPPPSLAFTWCQVPFVYQLDDDAEPSLTVTERGGRVQETSKLVLPTEISGELFARNGRVRQVNVVLPSKHLFSEQ
jgi:hypothetical protein